MSGHQSISKRQECLCRSYIGTLGAQNFPIGDQRSFHCPGSICPSTSFKLLRSSQDRLEVEKVSSRTLVYTTHQEGLPRVIPGPSFNPWHLPADDVMACDVLRLRCGHAPVHIPTQEVEKALVLVLPEGSLDRP